MMDTNTNRYYILSVLLFLSIALLVFFSYSNIHAQQQQKEAQGIDGITLSDPNLKLELVTSGLDFPTTMEFLGPDDFLILEKSGTVKRVTNGKVLDKPLLHVDVSEKDERGLLGIAVSEKKKNNSNNTSIPNKDISHNVFLYYVMCNEKNEDCKNQIYRYGLDNKNNVLVNPKLLLSIPSFPDPAHIGGIIRIGPDEDLYVTVGGFQNTGIPPTIKNKALNFEDGNDPDGRAGILRITQDGKPVNDGNGSIIGDNYPLNLYYAYGIRNSFGIDFDPKTDKLWDTEIGPQFGDEINLVEPGFNSGANKIFGIWKNDGLDYKLKEGKSNKSKSKSFVIVNETKPDDLVYLGKGHYNLPKFIWDKTVVPTALVFLDSKSLGKKYQNDIFVGSVKGGKLFHFELNTLRDDLILIGNLSDRIATDKKEFGDILFAEGFNYITDLKVGPNDGYLYIVSSFKSNDAKAGIVSKTGSVFRIVPTESTIKSNNNN
jgi:glucose/arabinose dehydrogenase